MKQDARRLKHSTLEEIRIRAVQQVQNGESPEAVIKALGFHRSCIYEWLARYRAGGWHALNSGKLEGRPKKLNGKQIRWVYDAVTLKSPLQYKFEFALWTRRMVRTLIYEKFGIHLSIWSVGRLLNQLGLSCQRPLMKAYEQNPELVEQWLKKDFPRIQELAKKEKALIFFEDEAGVRSDFHSGKTWAPRGQTPVVKTTGKRFGFNMISAVSSRGDMRFMIVPGKINASWFCEFLRRLVHKAPRPLFLIVDGHPMHKSKMVGDLVESLQGQLRIFIMPPYSPELNPDELVWCDLKQHGIGRMMVHDPEDLKDKVLRHLQVLQKDRQKIRSFYQTPTTKYAA
jgi:transposase